MDPRTESRVLGLISVALTLFGVFAPYQWREMPRIVTISALGLAAIFALLAIWLILPPRFKKGDGKVSILGPWVLIFCGPLLGALWLYMQQVNQSPVQATASQQPDKEAATTNERLQPDNSPPIGSLRYVIAKMELDIKSDLKKAAGRIEVEIHNDSDRLIKFHAVTAGNINGVAFHFNKVQFDGYVNPHRSSFLVSNRISDIPLSEQTGFDTPSVTGIYEYDLSYGDARETRFSRRTSKGMKILNWAPIMGKPKGTVIEKPVRVLLYNEFEE